MAGILLVCNTKLSCAHKPENLDESALEHQGTWKFGEKKIAGFHTKLLELCNLFVIYISHEHFDDPAIYRMFLDYFLCNALFIHLENTWELSMSKIL